MQIRLDLNIMCLIFCYNYQLGDAESENTIQHDLQYQRQYFPQTEKNYTQKELIKIASGLKPTLDLNNIKPLLQRIWLEIIKEKI